MSGDNKSEFKRAVELVRYAMNERIAKALTVELLNPFAVLKDDLYLVGLLEEQMKFDSDFARRIVKYIDNKTEN